MSLKLYLGLISIFIVFTNSQLLQSNRFNYISISNQNYTDLVEFSICGLSEDQLLNIKNVLKPTIIRSNQKTGPKFQSIVIFLHGPQYNASNAYLGCQDQNQNLNQFAINSHNSEVVIDLLVQNYTMKQKVSCIDELMIRQKLSNNFQAKQDLQSNNEQGPQLLRMVFHDALDFENLVDSKNQTVTMRTGIDSCIYSPFKFNMTSPNSSDADEFLNVGMNHALHFVQRHKKSLNQWISEPDVLALGSIVALEDWFKGPLVNFKFGRIKGNCSQTYCSRQTKNCQNQSILLKNSPQNSWSNSQNLQIFGNLKFNNKEAIALIGAHSVGGINVCTGFYQLSMGDFCSNKKKNVTNSSYFDQTPSLFDNNYYQMLMNIYNKQDIGANITHDNRSHKIVNQNNQFPGCQKLWTNQNYDQNYSLCQPNVQYCNQTDNKDTTREFMRNMINTTNNSNGEQRRIIHLSSDWSNLLNNETFGYIQQFANDQIDFFDTFSIAYEKLINTGYSVDELQSCSSVNCTLNSDNTQFQCNSQNDGQLNFLTNTCLPSGDEANASNCSLIGVYGSQGQIQCNGQLYFCPLNKKDTAFNDKKKIFTKW